MVCRTIGSVRCARITKEIFGSAPAAAWILCERGRLEWLIPRIIGKGGLFCPLELEQTGAPGLEPKELGSTIWKPIGGITSMRRTASPISSFGPFCKLD